MKKRSHSMEARRRRLIAALLGKLAIVHHSAFGSGQVRAVDLKHMRTCQLDDYQATALAQRAHRWSVLMCVMTDDGKMHTDIACARAPCLHAELAPLLEDPHQQLLARVKILIGLEGNGVRVHSYGWIAMPMQQDLHEEDAVRVFAAALQTVGRVAA